MTPYEAFKLYLALKSHFTLKTYDYFKYQGKVKATLASYNKRSDKWIFEKLAKHPDLHMYLVANFINNQHFWLGDFQTADNIFVKHQRKVQAIKYYFTQQLNDIGFFDNSIESLIQVKKGELPFLLDMFMRNNINLETLTIFIDAVGCTNYWNKELKGNVIWDHYGLLIKKYKPFLKYDKKEYLTLIKNSCKSTHQEV